VAATAETIAIATTNSEIKKEKNNSSLVKKVTLVFFISFALLLSSCGDENIVYDQNTSLPKDGWFYKNRATFDIDLKDSTHYHNFFINLRITPDYEYSNMYVLLYLKTPTGDSSARRIDLNPLAASDGKWLGKGSGSVISYRIPIFQQFVPKPTGIYHFEIEQNMRTNTLKEVLDVGMAVEKGEEVF
jgi:gliding motility-associated lipoprotein GldH